MATVHANKILTKLMLLLGGHNHCVKVSSNSETVRGMGLWEFSGALRELMLNWYVAFGMWVLQGFSNDDAKLTMTYLTSRSLLPNAFKLEIYLNGKFF